jgi:gas vesicle protein GvpO
MAESKSNTSGGSRRRSSSSSRRKSSGSKSGENNPRSPREIAIGAVEQAQQLIGRPIESITGIEKDGDAWTVTVEVLELERVPTTTDVLGKYEVTVDANGDLTGAQRTRRYPRAEAGEG